MGEEGLLMFVCLCDGLIGVCVSQNRGWVDGWGGVKDGVTSIGQSM